MAKTSIEWVRNADGTPGRTWNPLYGCSPVSVGCERCYAASMASRFSGVGEPMEGTAKGGRWTGRILLREDRLDQPLKWRKPQVIFVNSMSDLFHPDVPDAFVAEVFDRMACATLSCGKRHEHEEECWQGGQHTFIVLTKRPERMRRFLTDGIHEAMAGWQGETALGVTMDAGCWPLSNVWLGVSAENQETADERVPVLLATPAAHRFVSCEPLLGPVDLTNVSLARDEVSDTCDALSGTMCPSSGHPTIPNEFPSLEWVIAGGESGPRARPCHPDWVRLLRDDCVEASVPFLFKQMGSAWAKANGSRTSSGNDTDEWPKDIRVREFPR